MGSLGASCGIFMFLIGVLLMFASYTGLQVLFRVMLFMYDVGL